VVVNGYGQDLLGRLLPNDVVVEEIVYLFWFGQILELEVGRFGEFLFDDLIAEIDALIADVDAGPGDQFLDLLLRLAAERTFEKVTAVPELRHWSIPP